MDTPTPDEPAYDSQCLVCLKTVREGDELCHFHFEKRWVTICCPLCMEVFESDPQTYLGRKLPPRSNNPSF